MRVRLRNSHKILFSSTKNPDQKNNQIWLKVGPDFCNSKFISANGQNSPAAFTVPSCKNYTCDSGCVTLYRFIPLWMMNIDRNDTYLPKIGTGIWDFKFTSLPYNRRHSPCSHASREPYMRLGTCISYSPRDSPQRQGGASVPCRISQSCAGETFGYAAQGRSQEPQTFRIDAPWYGTRAMQMTTPRGQNCARRAQFCVSALCPLAPTPFDKISRNLVQGYSATRAFKICIS